MNRDASKLTRPIPSRRYAARLWLLLFLFAFRVVAQPMALVVHSAFLPPFESWHSAALPTRGTMWQDATTTITAKPIVQTATTVSVQ